jgi:SNF2 family DNA or RNA helicase
MKFEQGIDGPFLVAVPLSVLSTWMTEFKRFLPQMRVLKLHTGDQVEKERLKKEGSYVSSLLPTVQHCGNNMW